MQTSTLLSFQETDPNIDPNNRRKKILFHLSQPSLDSKLIGVRIVTIKKFSVVF